MKREWKTPSVEMLELSQTANGQAPSDDFDGPWVEINGQWYRPGNAEPLS